MDSRDHVLQARPRDIPGINNVWVPLRLDFGISLILNQESWH